MKLLLIQIIIPVVALLALFSAGAKWRRKELATRVFLLVSIFWVAVSVVVLLPQSTEMLAQLLGVGRGVDVVLYIAVLVLTYLVFRLYVRIEKLEREITTLVREIALRDKNSS